jgi:hypothetical protein
MLQGLGYSCNTGSPESVAYYQENKIVEHAFCGRRRESFKSRFAFSLRFCLFADFRFPFARGHNYFQCVSNAHVLQILRNKIGS